MDNHVKKGVREDGVKAGVRAGVGVGGWAARLGQKGGGAEGHDRLSQFQKGSRVFSVFGQFDLGQRKSYGMQFRGWSPEWWGNEGWAPKGGGPKISRFFFLLPSEIFTHSSFSGGFSWNFGGV